MRNLEIDCILFSAEFSSFSSALIERMAKLYQKHQFFVGTGFAKEGLAFNQGEKMPKKVQDAPAEVETSTIPVLPISQIQVYVLKEAVGKTKALARVVLGEQMQLTGLRIVDGANGLFVSYPNDPSYKGEDYRSLFYPITRELRESIEEALVRKYHEVLGA